MTLHWPAQLALLLYLILLALIAFNLAVVLELPLWSAALPPVLAVVAVAATWLIAGRRRALFVCLLALGSLGLLAVAAVLAAPAWQVIADGASRSWAGRMLPMFAAALALHACNLWVSTAAAGESDERVERLARLIYGPGIFTSLITALILCASLILGMEWLARGGPAGFDAQSITRRFLERGIIPPLTVLLFFWGLLLLLGKWWNDWYLRRALARWSAGLTLLRPSPFTAGFDALTANAAGLRTNAARINDNADDIETNRAGVAMALSLGALPQFRQGNSWGIAASTFESETAIAFGANFDMGADRVVRVGISSAGGETSGAVGFGMKF